MIIKSNSSITMIIAGSLSDLVASELRAKQSIGTNILN